MAIGMSLGVGGLLVHFVPLLTDLGADSVRAAEIASLLGLASVCGRIGVGETADHNAKKLNFGRFTPPPACLTSQR